MSEDETAVVHLQTPSITTIAPAMRGQRSTPLTPQELSAVAAMAARSGTVPGSTATMVTVASLTPAQVQAAAQRISAAQPSIAVSTTTAAGVYFRWD